MIQNAPTGCRRSVLRYNSLGRTRQRRVRAIVGALSAERCFAEEYDCYHGV